MVEQDVTAQIKVVQAVEQACAPQTELVVNGTLQQQTQTLVPFAQQARPLVPSSDELQVLTRMAQVFTVAKMAPACFDSAEKALAAMLRGRDLGISPSGSLTALYPVPQYDSQGAKSGMILGMYVDAMTGLITSRVPGFYTRDIKVSDDEAEIEFHRPGWPPLRVSRTAAWAHKKFQLVKNGKLKDNWAKDFSGMLVKRVLTIGYQRMFADVLGGLSPPDEIVEYAGSGVVVDATNFKEVVE